VIYSGAHHANEWITSLLLLKFVEELAEAIRQESCIFGVPGKQIAEAATIYTVPMVNPDGVDLVVGAIPAGTLPFEVARTFADFYPGIPFPTGWKANLAGVDLNLQYPAGWLQAREIKFSQGYTQPGPRDYVGRAPLTQPEAKALAGYTEYIDPELVLAWHTQGEVIYWQFRDIFVPGAKELGERLAQVSGYTLEDTPYESAFAGYKDWFIQNFRKPGYTIEAGSGENPLPLCQFDEIYRENLGILVTAALEILPKS
jgi:g-D-glutamyl-meso-diaminopimelate peptidase